MKNFEEKFEGGKFGEQGYQEADIAEQPDVLDDTAIEALKKELEKVSGNIGPKNEEQVRELRETIEEAKKNN